MSDNMTELQPEQIEKLVAENKKERKKKRWLILLLLLLLAFACAGGYLWWKEYSRPKSKYEMDQNALAGFLPGKTQEEIEAELNRIIAEGRFNASINSEMTLENGKLNVHIENVPANNYDMMVEVYLYPHENDTEDAQLIYKSGVIQKGFYIDTVDAQTNVEPGVYDGRALFTAVTADETQEEIGQTALNVIIQVK